MPDSQKPHQRFVFLDPQGTRWPRLRWVLVAGVLTTFAALCWFVWSLLVRPELKLPKTLNAMKGQLKAVAAKEAASPNAMNWKKFYANSRAAQERLARIRAQARSNRASSAEIRLGYYVDWDPNSYASLEEHAGSLTHLAPEWFTLKDTDSKLIYDPDKRLATFAASRGLTLIPMLSNLSGDDWQPEAVENLARGSGARRAEFIEELVNTLVEAKAGGVLLNWEQVDPGYRDEYTDLLDSLASALHERGMELWFTVALGEDFDTFDLDALSDFVDRFVATLHDESSTTDAPGPIAGQDWVSGWMTVLTKYGKPDQWIGALGAYAYDWNTTRKKAEVISFKDAMSRGSYASVDEKPVNAEEPSYNALFSFSNGVEEHTISFLDAVTFHNQLQLLRKAKFGGVAINRLGSEDPQLWDVLEWRNPPGPKALAALGDLRASNSITHVGHGEIVRVDDSKDDGKRIVTVAADGTLKASYVNFPNYPVLYHHGAGEPHQVAITFDDGPDPEWTPAILDILKKRNVKACFFMVGRNAEQYPGLVKRIIDEGHEIGNHTYSHANLAEMSPFRMKLELNMTQRLIESITGHSTTLFRPPYNADSNPASMDELLPLRVAQDDLGYTVVLEKVDPQDWAMPGADVILQRVKELRKEGNIILLHDAGGDRTQTLQALPRIIDYLRIRGDQIVTVGELLGTAREDLMPSVAQDAQPMEQIGASIGFKIWRTTVRLFWWFMICATGLVLVRTLLVAWLARRHHKRPDPIAVPHITTGVSVIIAAYNEEKVIAKTLHSVVDTEYSGAMEVVVIDDGSKDNTAAEVEAMAKTDPRIRLLRKANGGKAAALEHGLAQAQYPTVVFLDADTLFEPTTLNRLIAPLANPLVAAVSGHARVGNARSFIARCQCLEYICGFNLDRRAYTDWNCITVVPGAISAYRKSAIEAVGGFNHDTLAEDTDLTLSLHRLGYRIQYAPDAVAWTEAPETYATLAKQRFRWAFGTMQCLWKHRDLTFNTENIALGWFSLPSVWFFQIFLVALTPLVDGVLISGAVSDLLGGSMIIGREGGLWWYMAAFIGLDLFLAALACRMEGESLRKAWLIIPMRMAYRPLLAFVIWKSILRAIQGAFVGWGKLERTGTVPSRA